MKKNRVYSHGKQLVASKILNEENKNAIKQKDICYYIRWNSNFKHGYILTQCTIS
jgi:hypothetical protein